MEPFTMATLILLICAARVRWDPDIPTKSQQQPPNNHKENSR